MPTYVILANFTDKGIQEAKDTIDRANKFKEMAKKAGCSVKDMYWTLGDTDTLNIVEAPNDETLTALLLSVARKGFVKTRTMRAFTPADMAAILAKVD